jgi:hypothetical protein
LFASHQPSHHILNFFAKRNILLAQTLQPPPVVGGGASVTYGLVYLSHLIADGLSRVQKPINSELSGIQLRIPFFYVHGLFRFALAGLKRTITIYSLFHDRRSFEYDYATRRDRYMDTRLGISAHALAFFTHRECSERRQLHSFASCNAVLNFL